MTTQIAVSPTTEQDPAVEQAFEHGLVLTELLALFAYFLRYTSEGQRVGRELEADWQNACAQLKEDKLLIGNIVSCSQWLTNLKRNLEKNKRQELQRRRAQPASPPKRSRVSPTRARQALKFKNI